MSNKRVEITWLDSHGITSSWEYWDGLEELKPCVIISIGYLIKDRKDYKTIAQSVSDSQVLGRMTIPVGCIKKIRRLK